MASIGLVQMQCVRKCGVVWVVFVGLFVKKHVSLIVFSERELTFTFANEFTFAICYRPSVRLSDVCLSVCNVRAPYSGGSNFRQYFYGIRYLGQSLTSTENFTEIVPGEPLRLGS